jgi:hypothetical protein
LCPSNIFTFILAEDVEKTNGVYTEPGEEKCDCIDRGLKSINGGQKPKFTPGKFNLDHLNHLSLIS